MTTAETQVVNVTVVAREDLTEEGNDFDSKVSLDIPAFRSKFPVIVYIKDEELFKQLKKGSAWVIKLRKGAVGKDKDGSQLWHYRWYFDGLSDKPVGIVAGTTGTAPAAPVPAAAQTPAQAPATPPKATPAAAQGQGAATDGVPHQHAFTVSYGRTINRGNFESERIDFSMEFDRGEMAPQAAYVRVKATVLAMLGAKEPSDEPEPDDNANPENDLPF